MMYNRLQKIINRAVPRYLNVYLNNSRIPFIESQRYVFVFPEITGTRTILTFVAMSSIRQSRIEGVIQEELSTFFQRNAREICLGAMVSVTVVRVTADLSLARIYLSIFAGPPADEVLNNIQINASRIRGDVGRRLKNMKKIPELSFHIDDSLDYAMEIDSLLKK